MTISIIWFSTIRFSTLWPFRRYNIRRYDLFDVMTFSILCLSTLRHSILWFSMLYFRRYDFRSYDFRHSIPVPLKLLVSGILNILRYTNKNICIYKLIFNIFGFEPWSGPYQRREIERCINILTHTHALMHTKKWSIWTYTHTEVHTQDNKLNFRKMIV